MSRVRVIGLVALGVLAVLLFLVAPEEGRFSQTPTLVLVGVIALLWHLAWTDGVDAGAAATDHAVGAAPPATAGTAATGAAFEPSAVPVTASSIDATAEAASPDQEDEEDREEDLSMLPDPPADWPPPGVEVPMVFRADLVETDIIDLTDAAIADDGRIDLTPEFVAAPPPVPTPTPDAYVPPDAFVPTGADDGEHDPWLAFAAAMFRDD